MKLDIRDWLVVILVAFIMLASTAYLFVHPSGAAFATWSGVVSVVTGVYHWIFFKDSKVKDAT